jgi:hypothetical protein
MQTNDQGPPSTAQEKPSEAAGGSVRRWLAVWLADRDQKQIQMLKAERAALRRQELRNG